MSSSGPETFEALLETSDSAILLLDEAGALVERVTTADLLRGGRDLASDLARAGLRPGDRIGLWLHNGRRYLELLVACAAGGFVAVSINTRYGKDEADDLLNRSGARLVAVDSSTVDAAAGALPVLTSAQVPTDLLASSGSIAGGEAGSAGADAGPHTPFLVFTTSGTTSKPKMVLHHQRSIAVHATQVARSLPVDAEDVAYIAMPLCGVFGLTSLTSALAGDATIVVPPRFDVAATASAITEHRVTMVHGSDDMFHRLMEHDADLSSIRCGGYGRFNTSLDGIAERCDAAGARLMGLYGMSEVQALFAGRDSTLPLADRVTAGGRLLSPDATYRVVDGELQVRGPSLFAGYLAEGGDRLDHDLTASAFDGGWFRTGDLADAEGERSFAYIARMGDAMRLGGFLVAPAEIENVLVQVAGIEEAQVVEVDRPSGARPVAFVITSASLDEDAAIDHCAARLARYKVPVRIVATDAFPVTQSANGTKIRKSELRQAAMRLLGD